MKELEFYLGEDNGYNLAQRLKRLGVLKEWLGQEGFDRLSPFIVSPEKWNEFMTGIKTQSLPQSGLLNSMEYPDVQLQLKVKSLLFDKVVDAMHKKKSVEDLSDTELHLQTNGIYFTSDNDAHEWAYLASKKDPLIEKLRTKYGIDPKLEGRKKMKVTRLRKLPPSPSTSPAEIISTEPHFSDAEKRRQARANRELCSLMTDVKPSRRNPRSEKQQVLNQGLEFVLHELRKLGDVAEPFLAKVKKSDAPDYFDIIEFPMDLGLMMRKIKGNKYPNKKSFRDDIDLIASNCRKYNDQGSLYVQHVTVLQVKAYDLLEVVPDLDISEMDAEPMAEIPPPVPESQTADENSPVEVLIKEKPKKIKKKKKLSEPHWGEFQANESSKDSLPSMDNAGKLKDSQENLEKSTPVALEQVHESTESKVLEKSERSSNWYDQWLDASREMRMERYAQISLQRQLDFGDREAIIREPDGVGRFLEGRNQLKKRKFIGIEGDLGTAFDESQDDKAMQEESKFPEYSSGIVYVPEITDVLKDLKKESNRARKKLLKREKLASVGKNAMNRLILEKGAPVWMKRSNVSKVDLEIGAGLGLCPSLKRKFDSIETQSPDKAENPQSTFLNFHKFSKISSEIPVKVILRDPIISTRSISLRRSESPENSSEGHGNHAVDPEGSRTRPEYPENHQVDPENHIEGSRSPSHHGRSSNDSDDFSDSPNLSETFAESNRVTSAIIPLPEEVEGVPVVTMDYVLEVAIKKIAQAVGFDEVELDGLFILRDLVKEKVSSFASALRTVVDDYGNERPPLGLISSALDLALDTDLPDIKNFVEKAQNGEPSPIADSDVLPSPPLDQTDDQNAENVENLQAAHTIQSLPNFPNFQNLPNQHVIGSQPVGMWPPQVAQNESVLMQHQVVVESSPMGNERMFQPSQNVLFQGQSQHQLMVDSGQVNLQPLQFQQPQLQQINMPPLPVIPSFTQPQEVLNVQQIQPNTSNFMSHQTQLQVPNFQLIPQPQFQGDLNFRQSVQQVVVSQQLIGTAQPTSGPIRIIQSNDTLGNEQQNDLRMHLAAKTEPPSMLDSCQPQSQCSPSSVQRNKGLN